MAHTRSHSSIVSDIMDAPAHWHKSAFLELDCNGPRCARGRVYQMAGLLGVYRPETMRELVHRLRCSNCQAKQSLVILWKDMPSGERLGAHLILVGARRR
jgi:hypothetical protein